MRVLVGGFGVALLISGLGVASVAPPASMWSVGGHDIVCEIAFQRGKRVISRAFFQPRLLFSRANPPCGTTLFRDKRGLSRSVLIIIIFIRTTICLRLQ